MERILEAHQLAPHRIRAFKLSTDPKFAEKLKDVVGSTSILPPMRSFSRSTRRDPMGVGGDRRYSRVRLLPDSLWRRPMQIVTDRPQAPTAIRTDLGAIFVSLDSVDQPGWLHRCHRAVEKRCQSIQFAAAMSLARGRGSLSSRTKFEIRMGQVVPIIVIQEAGRDGFWIHRLLQDKGVESHVVDPASIATSRRRRRAKTDKIDGEALVRFASV